MIKVLNLTRMRILCQYLKMCTKRWSLKKAEENTHADYTEACGCDPPRRSSTTHREP